MATVPHDARFDVPVPDVSGLVTEDDTPVDNLYSERQQRLLTSPLYAGWEGPRDAEGATMPFVAMANVGLFATVKAPPLVPDVLVSVQVTLPDDVWIKQHRSYFVWEYGKVPDVVIEVVSNREGQELDEKFKRYARMRIPAYVVWDPERILGGAELHAFRLEGVVYAPVERAWIPELGLELMPWQGTFEQCTERWLRWHDTQGVVIPTGDEVARAERARAETERARAETERARAETERARAETAHARAEALAAKLRALGIDPDALR